MGHILNLSVNAFLWVTDTEDIEYTSEGQSRIEDLEVVQEWRTKGPLEKLHNIVVFIQSSPQRLQEFAKLLKNHRPVRDNKTRWNSWSRMLKVNT